MKLFHGDCLDVLANLPTRSVDAIVTDPPYGDTSLDWDKKVIRWPIELLRVLRPGGSMWVFGSFRYFFDAAAKGTFDGWSISHDVIWEKHNGSSFHADRFKRVHELAVHFYPTRYPWNSVYREVQYTHDAVKRQVRRKRRPPHMGEIEGSTYLSEDGGPRLVRSVIFERSCHGYAEHPTQKPEGIVAPLLRYACAPGGVVLDPFMGSGTTGVVAAAEDRRFIGIEKEAPYFEIAQRRVGEAYEAAILGVSRAA